MSPALGLPSMRGLARLSHPGKKHRASGRLKRVSPGLNKQIKQARISRPSKTKAKTLARFDFLTLDDVQTDGKRVFLRVDINVPLDPSTHEILDDTRIRRHV